MEQIRVVDMLEVLDIQVAWKKILEERGLKPYRIHTFSKEQILAKGIIPESEIGEGFLLDGEELFDASSICEREMKIIRNLPPGTKLPVITDPEILLIHNKVVEMQMFSIPKPPIFFHNRTSYTVLDVAYVENRGTEHLRIRQLSHGNFIDIFRRQTPMWVFEEINLENSRKREDSQLAREIMLTIMECVYPELNLGSSKVWMRYIPERRFTKKEIKVGMQKRVKDAIENPAFVLDQKKTG